MLLTTLLRRLALLPLAVLFGLCLAPADAKAATAPPVRVVYGFDREFPPFSYEEAGGAPVGFEVDLIRAVFNGTPVNLSMRPLSWDMVQVELSAGTIQVTSGLVRTDQRDQLYLFSDQPTFPLQIRLFTKVYNRYPSAALLRGQAVSVEQGSYQYRLLQDFGGVNVKPYKDRVAGLRALYNDEVAAYCGLMQNTYYYINKLNYGAITTVGTPLGITEMRFAVNRDRGDILALINQGMARVKESGEYDRLYRKWFVRELTNAERDAMVKAAKQAAVSAYAPYGAKGFGAAVLTVTGKVHTACTVENADLSLTLSAVRGAVSKAISEGDFEIRAAVLTMPDGVVVAPAPEDLQTLYEFGRGILVITEPAVGTYETHMLPELLPAPVIRNTVGTVTE